MATPQSSPLIPSFESLPEPISHEYKNGGESELQIIWHRLKKDKLALIGAGWLIFVILVSLVAPLISPYDPLDTSLKDRLQPIATSGHILGTDDLGRDLLSRLIWGGRITLLVGFGAVMVAMSIGTFLGLVTGYFGGWLDSVVMRLIDILMAFPAILLAIAIVAAIGPGLQNAMLAVAIVGIPYYARIVRGATLSLRGQEYVMASEALGSGSGMLLLTHIFPNSLPPLIIAATLDIGWMIIFAAGLSFLGIGAQPPTAEWGIMLSEGHKFIRQAPHASIVPGVAIFLVVLALNLFGDGIRDALDPRLRR